MLRFNKYQRILFIAITVFSTVNFSLGKTSDTLKLDKKISLLNDRAFMFFPSMSKIDEIHQDINWVTSISLNYDEINIQFSAVELFLLGDSNLFETVSKEKGNDYNNESARWKYNEFMSYSNFIRKKLENQDSLLAIMSTPTVFHTGRLNILVNNLLVMTADRSIFLIDVYTDAIGFKNKNRLIEFSELIFRTLRKGTRVNNLKARKECYKVADSKFYFKFSVPKDYFITYNSYDLKFYIHKYRNYNDSIWSKLTINSVQPITGEYDDYSENYDVNQTDFARKKGRFIRQRVNWRTFSRKFGNKTFLAIENVESKKLEDYINVFVATNSLSSMNEMMKIVKKTKLKRGRLFKVYN